MCEESLQGVRFNIKDMKIHSDPMQRKGGQIIPAARRAVLSSMLTAQPHLLEPVYLVEIQVNYIGGERQGWERSPVFFRSNFPKFKFWPNFPISLSIILQLQKK